MQNSERPSYRNSVRQIQNYLMWISRLDSDIPRVNPDGIYGKTTADSVYAFQKKYMESPDGRVDFETWKNLLYHYNSAKEILDPPQNISPFSQSLKDGVLRRGDRSELVMIIRIMLKSIGIDYPLGEDIYPSDIFDSDTANAVISFQQIHGLFPDGNVDKLTWNRLAASYNRSLFTE